MSKFVIKPATSETWANIPVAQRPHYIVETGENGEPLNVSELYADRHNAVRAAKTRGADYTVAPEIVIEDLEGGE